MSPGKVYLYRFDRFGEMWASRQVSSAVLVPNTTLVLSSEKHHVGWNRKKRLTVVKNTTVKLAFDDLDSKNQNDGIHLRRILQMMQAYEGTRAFDQDFACPLTSFKSFRNLSHIWPAFCWGPHPYFGPGPGQSDPKHRPGGNPRRLIGNKPLPIASRQRNRESDLNLTDT